MNNLSKELPYCNTLVIIMILFSRFVLNMESYHMGSRPYFSESLEEPKYKQYEPI